MYDNTLLLVVGGGFLSEKKLLTEFLKSELDEIDGALYGLFLFLGNNDLFPKFTSYAEKIVDEDAMAEIYILIGMIDEER